MSDDKIELVARFFWERDRATKWEDAAQPAREAAIRSARQIDTHRLNTIYDAIEFGRKLGVEQRLIPMYAPGERNGSIESAEELFK